MLFCLVAFYFFISLLISFESYCFWKSSLSESEAIGRITKSFFLFFINERLSNVIQS